MSVKPAGSRGSRASAAFGISDTNLFRGAISMMNMQQTMVIRHHVLDPMMHSQDIYIPQHALVMSVQQLPDEQPVLAVLEPEPRPAVEPRTIEVYRDGDLIAPGVNRRYIGGTRDGQTFCHWFEVLN